MIIAIDGPAASGKSTVAKAVAERLGLHYLDTGAMYRAVALAALDRGVALSDGPALTRLARSVGIDFDYRAGEQLPTRVLLDGADVTRRIRTPAVDGAVSAVARVPGVREALVALQRAIAQREDGCVVEGRDIGTVVFPDAEVKVFLTASTDERARRRHGDRERAGHEGRVQEVREDLVRRDEIDSTRQAGPLSVAHDAERLDTTRLSAQQVVEAVVTLAEAAR